jgi:xylulose-5-phosphate/fructose-6-phosphate phosphoketolase
MSYIFDPALSSAVPANYPVPPAPPVPGGPLSPELLDRMHRYWSAANYLTIGQIYLQANALLREPLQQEHIKPRLLGHWGTSPGLSFIYVHLNRLITERGADSSMPTAPHSITRTCSWSPWSGTARRRRGRSRAHGRERVS